MAPLKVIEVSPDWRDLAEDVLKMSTVLLGGALLEQYWFGRPLSTSSLMHSILVYSAGLGLFYGVVDRSLVRFVVKPGTEGYYHVQKRYG
jgi:hypothetical protein